MRCAACGATNRPNMAFCYECGEPFDDSPVETTSLREAPRRLHWELLLGGALLLAVATFAIVSGWQDATHASQGRAYREGQAAASAGKIAEALDAFTRAADYNDAPALRAALQPKVAALSTAYTTGVQQAETGAWWDATHSLRQAADLQVSYQDVATRLNEARVHSGPLFYRAPAGDGPPILWLAESDGSHPRALPGSGPASVLLALAPDDRWAVYSGGDAGSLWLLDVRTGDVTSLAQKLRQLNPPVNVRFRDDSAGFWWSFTNQAFYYDLATAIGLPLTEIPGAVDARRGRLLLNHPLVGDFRVLHTRLLLSDALGRNRLLLVDEPGDVHDAAFSDDGQYLVYVRETRSTGDLPVPQVVTRTLVLYDLDSADGPARTVLDTQIGDAEHPATMRAGFVPGTTAVLSRLESPQGWTLRRWMPGVPGASVTLATGRAVGAKPTEVPAPLVAVPGGHWLATHLINPAGAQPEATLMRVDTATSRPADFGHQDWIAFSPDGGTLLAANDDLGTLVAAPVAESLDAAAIRPFPAEVVPANAVFSRDGTRVLALGTFAAGDGLYALRPDGSDPILVTKGATAFWAGGRPHPVLAGPTEANFLDR